MSVHLQLGTAIANLDGINARIFAGRDPAACQLAFADATLSRRHAEIYVENGVTYIRDLGSSNGTWVNGVHLGNGATPLAPGQQVWLGHVALGISWEGPVGVVGSATVMSQDVPPELEALMAARQQAHAEMATTPAPAAAASVASASGSLAASHTSTPLPAELAYRKQGNNSNGVLLLALPQDTFWNGGTIDGYVEFTSLDNQTIASITVELVEIDARGSSHGHVWDRFLVRQGPWRAAHNDVLPLPFQLRVPAGTAMTSRNVSWEIRGNVDINWSFDIHDAIPITMRNQDIERLRDALGALDYRVVEIESASLGQHFEGTFAPPAQLASKLGINEIKLVVEYLGANLKLHMILERRGLHHDRALDQTFELGRLRSASQAEVNATLAAMLEQLLPK